MAHHHLQNDPEPQTPLPADSPTHQAFGAGSTCDRVTAELADYAASSLSPLDRVGVEHHLSLCAACRLLADEYLEVIRLAESLPDVRPSPAAEARLRRFIEKAIGGPGRSETG